MNILQKTASVVFLFLAGSVMAAEVPATPHARLVVVQPIIVRDDTGQAPAPFRLDPAKVSHAYSRAGVAICFLPAVHWNCSDVRDGKVNLDTAVKRATEAGFLAGNTRLLHMFFINAVDGRPGPLGRTRQAGNVLFIAQGEVSKPEVDVFVVAHEIGHSLNLRHVAEAPETAPAGRPNLMGEGAYALRTAPEGLSDAQIQTVLKSPYVVEGPSSRP